MHLGRAEGGGGRELTLIFESERINRIQSVVTKIEVVSLPEAVPD